MRFIIPIVFILIVSGCKLIRREAEVDFSSEWDTTRLIKNPGKGWYHHLLDNGIDKYEVSDDSVFDHFPAMDHIYLRLAWSYLEPVEGKFDWQRIDTIIEKYVKRGYGVAFRITSKETGRYPGSVNQEVDGVQYATPYWVRKAGSKGIIAERGDTRSWTPDWDDPVYLAKLDNFQRAFAEKYDGKPWVRYIDIGSIGEWGEGHTSFSTKIPPAAEEVKANIEIYLKNFRKSQLICTDDLIYYGKDENTVNELLEYAISNGISLRDDSPLVDWYIKNNLKTWSISHPRFYDPLYLTKPIIFELQHYGIVKKDGNWLGENGADTIKKYGYSGAEIMRKAIRTMHASYIGFHGYAGEWLADNPDLSIELSNLCGYWYFPVIVTFKRIMHPGENQVDFKWLNKGVAPAYERFNLVLRFEKPGKQLLTDVPVYESGNRRWLPGIVCDESYKVALPENMLPGKYMLKFKLQKKDIPVDIGLRRNMFDSDGFAEIGYISVKDSN